MTLARKALAEGVGTAALLCAVIGSGIMAERLAGGNTAVALLANTLATVFALEPGTLAIEWQQSARLFNTSVITGSISHHDNRLFVPIRAG